MNPILRNIFLSLTILIITICLYLPVKDYGFLNWDDPLYVTQNPLIYSFTPDRIYKIFTSLTFANYHPVTLLLFTAEYQLFRMNPAGYHLTNAAIHSINGVLCFFLLMTFGLEVFAAFAIALIFAVHPMQAESVAWISSQKTLISGLFALLSLLQFQLFLKHGRGLSYALAFLYFLISVFSKPTAIILPGVFFLQYWLAHPNKKLSAFFSKALRLFWPFALLALVETVLVFSGHQKERAIAPLAGNSWINQSVLPGWTLAVYLKKIFFPNDLLPLYPKLAGVSWSNPVYAVPSLASMALFAGLFMIRNRFRLLFFFAGLFVLSLLPTLNILPLAAPLADRYVYLPIIPALGMVTVILRPFYQRGVLRPVAAVLSVVFALTLGAVTLRVIPQWSDTKTLWDSVIAKVPDHPLAHVKLSDYHYERAEVDRAIELLQKAISLGLNNPLFAKNLVAMYISKGDLAKARQSALEFVSQAPQDERFLIQLGIIESKERNTAKAEEYLKKAAEIKPSNPYTWHELGRFYLENERFDEAYAALLKAVQMDPYQPSFHVSMADIFSRKGFYDQAISALKQAVSLDEFSYDAWFNLGQILNLTGQKEAAETALKKAREISAKRKVTPVTQSDIS